MPKYLPEPARNPQAVPKTGILLINLGTPEAPTPQALRPYLKQFLSDPRVVEIPRLAWWLILNGIILNTRPRKSAEKYAAIWAKDGSPLLVHTQKQAKLLQGLLGERGHNDLVVAFAMRYGNPSIESVLAGMRKAGVERFLVIPLYPQYAASSSATALDAVFEVFARMRNMPDVRTVRHFYNDMGYIKALAQNVREHWQHHGRAQKLVMSFHGVPRFTLDKGDPYRDECLATGQLLAKELGLTQEEYVIAFQSRFGRTEWIKPYASEVFAQLGKAKVRQIDVICPGFIADCLETLEEIAMEGKETFLTAGGGEYRYIPCLNESPAGIAALADLALNNLAGWIDSRSDTSKEHQALGES